jgi:hypothetical protein
MRRNPVTRPEPNKCQRQDVAGRGRQAGIAPRRGGKSNVVSPIRPTRPIGFAIVDDFPKRIPVCGRELDVIETYLCDLLDEALGRPD